MTRAGEEGEKLGGLRGRGSSSVRHHGGQEHRRTRPWGVVQNSMQRGLNVNGRVGEGSGKGVPKPAEEESIVALKMCFAGTAFGKMLAGEHPRNHAVTKYSSLQVVY